jgi:hypothetical protein
MNYPDRERLEKNADQQESPLKPLTMAKSLSSLMEEKREARFPVGKLKWSKEEEGKQETEQDLSQKAAPETSSGHDGNVEPVSERKVPEPLKDHPPEDKVDKEDLSSVEDKTEGESDAVHSSKTAEASGDAPGEEPKQKEEPEPSVNSLPLQRNLSLEDTLTPIDFKEYSVDPVQMSSVEDEWVEWKEPVFSTRKESAGDWPETEEEPEEEKKGLPRFARLAIRILWLPVTLVAVLIIGLIIGHTVIGKEPASDIFDWNMWKHLYDLIYG